MKVLDFGVAKVMAPDVPDATTFATPDATGPGAVLGSIGYMSPEQAQGRIVNAKSDVFSFGVVVYELLTGQRPGTAVSAAGALERNRRRGCRHGAQEPSRRTGGPHGGMPFAGPAGVQTCTTSASDSARFGRSRRSRLGIFCAAGGQHRPARLRNSDRCWCLLLVVLRPRRARRARPHARDSVARREARCRWLLPRRPDRRAGVEGRPAPAQPLDQPDDDRDLRQPSFGGRGVGEGV